MTHIFLVDGADTIDADSHHVIYELYGVRVDDGKGGHRLIPWSRVYSVVKDPE